MAALSVLIVNSDTFFKLDYTKQADQLPDNQKYKVFGGQTYSYKSIDNNVQQYNGHWSVDFEPALNGIHTWFVYPSDVTQQ